MSPHSPDAQEGSDLNSDASVRTPPGDVKDSRRRSTEAPAEKRVSLACHRCRAKRARCSGDRPVCAACEKAQEECIWPSGRKRKRTRREMEEDERKEREAALNQSQQAILSNGLFQAVPVQPYAYASSSKNGFPLDFASTIPHASPVPLSALPSSFETSPPLMQWPSTSTQGALFGQPMQHDATVFPSGSQSAPQFQRSGNSPLYRAIESDLAFIEGDPASQEDLELFYYRISGSTAIRPGINRISLKLQRRANDSKPDMSSPLPSGDTPSMVDQLEYQFDDAGLPHPSIYRPLLDTFFATLSGHFPSIHRRRMEERLNTGTMSAFLLNCICALSARFYPPSSQCPLKASAPFITKAQELIIPLLHLPTTDSVTGLLLLAWANYGQVNAFVLHHCQLFKTSNIELRKWTVAIFRASAFETISNIVNIPNHRMAIRMALDLGLHEISELYESSAHVIRTRLLFWSIFITDRVLAFSTGRPPTIPEELIDIPLPSDDDFVPDPAKSSLGPSDVLEVPQPTPFTHIVKLMILCGRIANLLNGRRWRASPSAGASQSDAQMLDTLQNQLVEFYSQLPEAMKWSVEAFKHQETRGHGGSFLTLHLWANSVLALVYHPQLLCKQAGVDSPLSSTADTSVGVKLSLSSSRIITECLVFADLYASRSYLASPFAVQPIFVACLAFISEIKSGKSPNEREKPQTVDVLLTSLARQNVGVLAKALQRMEHYWAGVNFVLEILEQKADGLGFSIKSHNSSPKTFISLPDKGLLRRFTSKDPNTAPPTETSLRESMAKEVSEMNTCSLDDLFDTYSIQGLLVQPAEALDLQKLIPSGAGLWKYQ